MFFSGVNDLGGVSPITIDYVNPESPWPQIDLMKIQFPNLVLIYVRDCQYIPNIYRLITLKIIFLGGQKSL